LGDREEGFDASNMPHPVDLCGCMIEDIHVNSNWGIINLGDACPVNTTREDLESHCGTICTHLDFAETNFYCDKAYLDANDHCHIYENVLLEVPCTNGTTMGHCGTPHPSPIPTYDPTFAPTYAPHLGLECNNVCYTTTYANRKWFGDRIMGWGRDNLPHKLDMCYCDFRDEYLFPNDGIIDMGQACTFNNTADYIINCGLLATFLGDQVGFITEGAYLDSTYKCHMYETVGPKIYHAGSTAMELCNEDPPTPEPTISPTKGPTVSPTISPSGSPTWSPSTSPSQSPSLQPSHSPSASPSVSPVSDSPSESPTASPTHGPSLSPTFVGVVPTQSPSSNPTTTPTESPSKTPSSSPSQGPTTGPTRSPSQSPTTQTPTQTPTEAPTTPLPTVSPTDSPNTKECYAECYDPNIQEGYQWIGDPEFGFLQQHMPPKHQICDCDVSNIYIDTLNGIIDLNGACDIGKNITSMQQRNICGMICKHLRDWEVGFYCEKATYVNPSGECHILQAVGGTQMEPTCDAIGPCETMEPTPHPTPEPTSGPTHSPSLDVPTPEPTDSPTPSPLPTPNPTKSPTTESPTQSPLELGTPTQSPIPTTSPTEFPTASPTEFPTQSPITTSPTQSPISTSLAPTHSPNDKECFTQCYDPTFEEESQWLGDVNDEFDASHLPLPEMVCSCRFEDEHIENGAIDFGEACPIEEKNITSMQLYDLCGWTCWFLQHTQGQPCQHYNYNFMLNKCVILEHQMGRVYEEDCVSG